MARHRSPQGRRTHLGLPLPSFPTAAEAGGGAKATLSSVPLAPRVIATVLAGGALAAAGQAALTQALPVASDGANVLKLSVQEVLGDPAPVAPPVDLGPTAGSIATVATVAPEPRQVDVAELVKAADLHRRAAQPATPAPRTDRPAVETDATPGGSAATGVAKPPAAREPSSPRVPDVLKPPAPRTAPEARKRPAPPIARTPEARPSSDPVRLVAGRVTSGFGARWGSQHRGLDIAAPIGTPIHAPLAGEVIASGPASGFGLWVRVRHDDGTVTTYGHVNRSLVRVGDEVRAGQRIAEVGNRGRSTGPHLHLEVDTPGGSKVDPRPWLDARDINY